MDRVEIAFDIGDCKKLMHDNLEDDSIDSCVCDPPYGLEFMGKEWDKLWGENKLGVKPSGSPSPTYLPLKSSNLRCKKCGHWWQSGTPCTCKDPEWERPPMEWKIPKKIQSWHEAWTKEVFRVLKPGAHILAFSGSRTFHRLGCAVEDVGFTIRDCLIWMYGQGFPKGTNISKSIDKHFGKKGKIIGYKDCGLDQGSVNIEFTNSRDETGLIPVYEPATDEAKQWEGWFTGLKPAWEPIVMGRKPAGEKTLTLNVMKHGTGALNIDACRIEHSEPTKTTQRIERGRDDLFRHDNERNVVAGPSPEGRYPSNVLLECICDEVIPGESADLEFKKRWLGGNVYGEGKGYSTDFEESSVMRTYNDTAPIHTNPECPCAVLDGKSGNLTGPWGKESLGKNQTSWFGATSDSRGKLYRDQGGASRYFYVAKSSRGEREMGLKGILPCGNCGKIDSDYHMVGEREIGCIRNNHPTVKPIELMRYLIRLVTPPGGTVLDPFLGSGTTLIAARKEARSGIGYEKDETMRPIIEGRLSSMTRSLWEF